MKEIKTETTTNFNGQNESELSDEQIERVAKLKAQATPENLVSDIRVRIYKGEDCMLTSVDAEPKQKTTLAGMTTTLAARGINATLENVTDKMSRLVGLTNLMDAHDKVKNCAECAGRGTCPLADSPAAKMGGSIKCDGGDSQREIKKPATPAPAENTSRKNV